MAPPSQYDVPLALRPTEFTRLCCPFSEFCISVENAAAFVEVLSITAAASSVLPIIKPMTAATTARAAAIASTISTVFVDMVLNVVCAADCKVVTSVSVFMTDTIFRNVAAKAPITPIIARAVGFIFDNKSTTFSRIGAKAEASSFLAPWKTESSLSIASCSLPAASTSSSLITMPRS